MREILFRGRTVSESEYLDDGEWIEGFYTCFNGEEHRIYTGYAETDCGDYYPDWFNVIPETVGQYTGLTDKNGKRIFEGDIVRTKFGRYCKVVWKHTNCFIGWDFEVCDFQFKIDDFGKPPSSWDLYCPNNLELVDNPELLKESEDTE